MIDWDKIGPSNSPSPDAPTTTMPVAPVPVGGMGEYTTGQGWRPASQAEVDTLDPAERMGRGIDYLGYLLFGNKPGQEQYGHQAPLAGLQPVREVVGGLGDAAHTFLKTTTVAPFEAGAAAAARVPLGWLPGGSDESFNRIGEWSKTNDPAVYQQWQLIQAAADADILYGGNLKADFNLEVAKYLDDKQYEGTLGHTPELALGREAIGSLGGAFSHAVQGWLGVLGNVSKRELGEAGMFDPGGNQASYEDQKKAWEAKQAGTTYLDASNHSVGVGDEQSVYFQRLKDGLITEAEARAAVEEISKGGRNRLEESASRLDLGLEVSEVEKRAVEAWRSGEWSAAHAQDWLVRSGQGVTRNFLGELAVGVAVDPLTYATIGAGSVAKAGQVGAKVAQVAGQGASLAEKLAVAESAYQRLGVVVRATQELQVAGHELGPAFRFARGMIDPLAVYKPSSIQRAVTDLRNGAAISAFDRAYGHFAVKDVRALAREFGIADEIDSAIATYSIDQANLMIAMRAQRNGLAEGFGESMIHSNVDEVVDPLAQQADRDAITQLTDHMLKTSKNTFTPEEETLLQARMAVVFGHDVDYWAKRLPTMSEDARRALHALTYKRAEVDFEEARAMVVADTYGGDLPLGQMVLVSSETLDNEIAEAIIENIRAVLKNENEPERIAAATAEWNNQAARYPYLENIGFATGGKEQVEALVKQLEKDLEAGKITKIAGIKEMSDPALKPMRDMIARHSVPTGMPMSAAEVAARRKVLAADAMYAIRKAGFEEVSAAKFFPAIRKAVAVRKSNGRLVGETVYVYSKGEYAKMRMFLTADKKTGFAIKEDGDLVSVFNVGQKGKIQEVVPHLNAIGATKLDAFDEAGRLPDLYGAGGFKEVRREAWDPAQAPPGWTGGKPDVVYMEHPGMPTTLPASKPLWKIGFRPDEEVAWGLRRSDETGRYMVDRAPTISHVVDAVPGRQHFSDTTRNVLGQVIGKSKAERLNKPVDSIEAFINTQKDMVTGQRMVLNIERRFEANMVKIGVPKPIARDIFAKARDVAGLDYTTVRGLRPVNLWTEIHDLIPRDLILKDGSRVNIHTVMDALLQASEGDLRIMGVSSVLSQRMRNAFRKAGIDANNSLGQLTVTEYNRLRYMFNPMFVIQRITDAPYYSLLYGVMPVGKLSAVNKELRVITDNLGLTGLARHFSMDMPEYATRSNFTAGIKSLMQQAGLKDHHLQRVLEAPDTIIANNMTNMMHARLGDMVIGSLENLKAAATRDPELAAEMHAAGEALTRSIEDWRQVYSQQVGHIVDDNELGLMYLKDQLMAWRRHVVNEDGTLDFSRLIAEGDRFLPSDIGSIESIKPDILAQELGYADSTALRRDIVGHVEKINGEFILVKGEKDLAWLEEHLTSTLHANPDYVKRALAYYTETWDDFWHRLSLPLDKGGLDISPHYAKEAQDVIALLAQERGMDPWEYLSGVMATNIGPEQLDTAAGRLVNFLKGGPGAGAPGSDKQWGAFYRTHLDPSAQKLLFDEYGTAAAQPIEFAKFGQTVPRSAPGRPARPPVATLPPVFKHEAGYVYRVETPEAMMSGLPERAGVTTGAPTPFYEGAGGAQKAIFRIKDDGTLATGRHGEGGADRLTTKAYAPTDIEILAPDGSWKPLPPDPVQKFWDEGVVDMWVKRVADGEHPNADVEGALQYLAKITQRVLKGTEAEKGTRTTLRELTQAIPTAQAAPFNRSQMLLVSLLKQKIEDAQQDVFRLAEMQTKRSVLERSLNHPLFGLYPASYMWGKVLPETVKFLAKNPYAATYTIANVQRSIAIQREYDTDLDAQVNAVDRSAGAFLLDYMTPGLPWSDHSARTSPMWRGIMNGKDIGWIWDAELSTVSPHRWVSQVVETMREVPGAVEELSAPEPSWAPALQSLPSAAPTSQGGTGESQITGPIKASALGPILQDDLTRLSSILLEGADAGEE